MTRFPTELHRLYTENRTLFDEKFYALVLRASKMISFRYPPKVYNNNQRWSEEEYLDLANDVFLKQLLKAETDATATNQIDYIMTHAKTEQAIMGLIGYHVKLTLNGRRQRTVVDRLIVRIRKLCSSGEITMQEFPGATYFSLPSVGDFRPVQVTESDLNRAANAVRQLPIIWLQPDAKRESSVYTAEDLMKAIKVVISITKCISEKDLRTILEKVLTAFLPTNISNSAGGEKAMSEEVAQILLVEIEESIQVFVNGLKAEELVVLVAHSRAIPDHEVGQVIGKVRQTVVEYRSKLVDKLNILLGSMSPSDSPEVAVKRLIEVALARLETLGMFQSIDELGSLS